jgi:hypothetical protein
MSTLKNVLLVILVVVALMKTGMGGMLDMLGIRPFGLSPTHAWADAIIILLFAILLSLTMK